MSHLLAFEQLENDILQYWPIMESKAGRQRGANSTKQRFVLSRKFASSGCSSFGLLCSEPDNKNQIHCLVCHPGACYNYYLYSRLLDDATAAVSRPLLFTAACVPFEYPEWDQQFQHVVQFWSLISLDVTIGNSSGLRELAEKTKYGKRRASILTKDKSKITCFEADFWLPKKEAQTIVDKAFRYGVNVCFQHQQPCEETDYAALVRFAVETFRLRVHDVTVHGEPLNFDDVTDNDQDERELFEEFTSSILTWMKECDVIVSLASIMAVLIIFFSNKGLSKAENKYKRTKKDVDEAYLAYVNLVLDDQCSTASTRARVKELLASDTSSNSEDSSDD